MRKIKNNCRAIACILICAGSYILVSCSSNHKPQKQGHVPETAYWIGGTDGGYWLSTNVIKQNELWHFSVYNEYPGELVDSGVFTVCSECKGLPLGDIKTAINAYDGQKFLLNKSVKNKSCTIYKIK